MSALITNKNKPSVKTVIGSVKKINIGLTNTLSTARTSESIIAVVTLLTETPGINLVTNKMANVVVKMRTRKLMLKIFVNVKKLYTRESKNFCTE